MKRLYNIGFIFIIVTSSATGALSHWEWINPYPAGNHLYAITRFGESAVLCGGDAGMALEYASGTFTVPELPVSERINDISAINGHGVIAGEHAMALLLEGSEWVSRPPETTAWFYGACATESGDIWVCGDSGKIFHYDGAQWEDTYSGTASTLKDIDMAGDSFGVAVGLFGTARTWNGSSWQYTSSGTSRFLRHVSVFSATRAWAVGDLGTIITWDGGGFHTESSPTSRNLYSVFAVSDDEAWAVGDGGTILHRLDGAWQEMAFPELPELDFRSVMFDSATDTLWITGKYGFIAKYDGSAWNRLDENATGGTDIFDAEISADGELFYCGASGNIWRYDASGFHAETTGTEEDILTLHAAADGSVWAGGKHGTLMKRTGKGWTPVSTGSTDDIHDIQSLSPTSVWTAGGTSDETCVSWTVLHYNGTTWEEYSESGS